MAPIRTRSLEDVRDSGDLPWFMPAVDRVRAAQAGTGEWASFLSPGRPTWIGRAPGRLDVMGGIADYSGSLVLEMPLDRATIVVAQRRDDGRLDIASLRGGRPSRFAIDLADVLGPGARLAEPAALASWFRERPADRWASYVVGSVARCLSLAGVVQSAHGLGLLVTSAVPEGKGVSSSAALEVAVMAATAACCGVAMSGAELATACQWAENHIALAPCGIMDQMTAALGRRDRLLRLRCQPATVEGHVAIPPGYRFYGIDSGVRHAVTGADYGTVRTAAFMGYRMLADAVGMRAKSCRDESGGARVEVDDQRWGGYLANLTPTELAELIAVLPERMGGSAFLDRYSGITDAVTRVEPDRSYAVRAATSHPVHEHARVMRFAHLLERLGGGHDHSHVADALGALMFESHASYGACGLGSDGTDRLADLVRDAGRPLGLVGAKITGGGSGGTVAVLGTDAAGPAVRDVARRYERETGRRAVVFDGSGPGAEEIGVLRLG